MECFGSLRCRHRRQQQCCGPDELTVHAWILRAREQRWHEQPDPGALVSSPGFFIAHQTRRRHRGGLKYPSAGGGIHPVAGVMLQELKRRIK